MLASRFRRSDLAQTVRAAIVLAATLPLVVLTGAPAEATPIVYGSSGACTFSIRNYQSTTGYQGSANAYSTGGRYCARYSVRIGNSANGHDAWGPTGYSPNMSWALSRGVTTAPQGARWYSDHRFTRTDGVTFCLRLYFGNGTKIGSCAAHENALLFPGGRLLPGQSMWTGNGHALIMQGDGNLVLYAPGGVVRWHSRTNGHPGAWAIMQTDGNLVVYSARGVALGYTRTAGHPGAYLAVQTDSNLVVYSGGGTPLWNRFTNPWYR